MYIVLLIIVIAFVVLAIIRTSEKINPEEFSTITDILNKRVYSGKGKVTIIDRKTVKLHDERSNISINFFYDKYYTGYLMLSCYVHGQYAGQGKIDMRGVTTEEQIAFANEIFPNLKLI